ncbi:autotransporter domain-containing protein, partial [Desulfovibrio aminophilus]|uniref:autotransporter domain-containing protein n=1 Tax=Desulfovibrio aminophilus TaxID=81425 RepID=UPI003390E117
ASGVSADGSIVVGYSFNNAGDHEAFRWVSDGTPTGGTMTGLGFLADTGHYLSSASGVSADGSVVVGYSDTNIMVPAAFLWTEGTGMVSLASVLQNAGVDLTGWTLSTATGVSGDGNIIVGVDEYQSVGFIANVTAGGLITPEALNQSLGAMGQVGPAVSGMGQLSMSRLGGVAGGQGAHVRVAGGPGGHEQGLAGGDETPGRLDLWAVGSLGSNVELNGDDLGLHGGLGLSWDNGGEWRFGGGLFADSRDLDTDYHGNQDIQAVGPGVFVAYRPEDTGLEFRVSSLWQSVDLDLKRGYLNGAGYAASSGSTNAEVFGISGRAQWTKPVTGSLDLTPFAEYTWQTCHIDGYSESDGPFPASYDSRTEESNSIRTGLRADLALFEDLGLWTWGAWNHRFEDSSSGLGGTATGLGAFSYSGATLDQDWADLGVGLTRRFSDRLTTTFSLGGALGCDDDSVPDLTATVGFSYQLW